MLRDALLVSGRIIWALRTGNQLVGRLKRVPYDPADREDPWEVGREALVVYGTCAAPNTMVAEVDTRGNLLIHELVAREQPHESDRWPL